MHIGATTKAGAVIERVQLLSERRAGFCDP